MTAFWQMAKDEIEVFSNTRCLEVAGGSATVRAENRQQPSTEAAIFKLDLTWWRSPIWIRVNQFKFVRNAAPVPARNGLQWTEGLVSEMKENWNLKSGIKSPFSKLLPQAFSSYCFSNLFSISTTHWSQFLFWRHNEGMSGTIHFTARKSFSIGGSAFSPFPEY